MDNGRMAVDPKFEDPVVRRQVMDVINTVLVGATKPGVSDS